MEIPECPHHTGPSQNWADVFQCDGWAQESCFCKIPLNPESSGICSVIYLAHTHYIEAQDLLYLEIHPEIFLHGISDTQVIVRQAPKHLFIPDKNEISVKNHRQAIAATAPSAHAQGKPNKTQRNPTAPRTGMWLPIFDGLLLSKAFKAFNYT